MESKVKGTSLSNTNMDSSRAGSDGVYTSSRKQIKTLSAEELRRINDESRNVGIKRDKFSPAVVVDISKNAKKLWQDALEKRGGIMNIAKPYFSSRLLDKMREAGELGPSGVASLAYRRMVDIFI